MTTRYVFEVEFTTYWDPGNDALAIAINSRSSSRYWWKNGPHKDKLEPAPVDPGVSNLLSDLKAIKPKRAAAPRATRPTTPKAKPKATPKSRALSPEEQLELKLFGVIPVDGPIDLDPDDLPVVDDPPTGIDPPLPPPLDDPSDDDGEISVVLGGPGGASSDGEEEIEVIVRRYISHDAARSLIGPVVGNKSPITHPQDPSKIIGEVSLPFEDFRKFAMKCKIHGRAYRCSRTMGRFDGEPADYPITILVRWLVKGLDLTAGEKSMTDQHVGIKREAGVFVPFVGAAPPGAAMPGP